MGGGGGKVHPGENFTDAGKRQIKDELVIDVTIIAPHSTYEMPTPDLPQIKIPGILFLCKHLFGEPTVNSKEHAQWRWQPLTSLADFDFLSTLKSVIPEAAKLYHLILSSHTR